jgi:hypothetical protein
MALTKIYSKTLGQIPADGKTEINYAGTKTVCTGIEKVDDTTAKIYLTAKKFAPKETSGVFEIAAEVVAVQDMTVTVGDVTVFEEIEDEATEDASDSEEQANA